MRMFKLPKTTRWIIACSAIMFLVVAGYRFVIFALFKDLFAGAQPSIGRSYLLGFAFDMRLVSLPMVLIFALSFWPGLHYFKTKTGKKIALVLMGISLAVIHFFYVMDIVHLKCFGQRITAAIISDLAKDTPRGLQFKQKIEWFPLIVTMALLVWLFVFAAARLHKAITKIRGTEHASVRIFWQSLVLLLFVFFIFGGLRKQPLSLNTAGDKHNQASLQLAATPLESILSSWPKKTAAK